MKPHRFRLRCECGKWTLTRAEPAGKREQVSPRILGNSWLSFRKSLVLALAGRSVEFEHQLALQPVPEALRVTIRADDNYDSSRLNVN